MSQDFVAIVEELTDKVQNDHPADSFRRLFWEQQLKATRIKDKWQIRWHPALIKWSLHLKYLLAGAYHALHSSMSLMLPSERTLHDYSHCVKSRVGFPQR